MPPRSRSPTKINRFRGNSPESTLASGAAKKAGKKGPALRRHLRTLLPELTVETSKAHFQMRSWVAHARSATLALPNYAVHDLLAILCLRSR